MNHDTSVEFTYIRVFVHKQNLHSASKVSNYYNILWIKQKRKMSLRISIG